MLKTNVAHWVILLLAAIPGIFGVGIFGNYALVDWSARNESVQVSLRGFSGATSVS